MAAELPSNSAPDAEEVRARRRRRKAIRSCTFCRHRKLKCDHKRPMCGSCAARKLPECIYVDSFNFQLTSDELFSNKPNVALVRRIQELEEELERNCIEDAVDTTDRDQELDTSSSSNTLSSKRTSSLAGKSERNIITELSVFELKEGRAIYHGPTSVEATINSSGERYAIEYRKFWAKMTTDLNSWKGVHGRLITSEFCAISSPQSSSILDAIIPDLPSYEVINQKLHEFFDGPLHEYFQFLDPPKTLAEFVHFFIPEFVTNVKTDGMPERPIVMLITPKNENPFAIGIIVMILSITYYKTALPESIARLMVTLMGFSTARSNYVEKAQFLLLNCLFRAYHGLNGFGSSNLVAVVSHLTSTVLRLGLHMDIDALYSKQEHLVGSVHSIKNVWYWTLFVDLCVSFDVGAPLNISYTHYDNLRLLTPEKGREALLRNFLYIGRKCMFELYACKECPDLCQMAEDLVSFIESHFSPLQYYTNSTLFEQVDLFDVIILSPVLAMITNYYNLLRILCMQGRITQTLTFFQKNRFFKCMLGATSLMVNTIVRCYRMDLECVPAEEFAQQKALTPSLNLCVLVLNTFPIRVLTESYGLMLFKLALFETGKSIFMDSCQNPPAYPSLNDLSAPEDTLYSLTDCFQVFSSIVDELWRPENERMIQMLRNSRYYVIMIGLERINRKVFQQALDKRTQMESTHNWSKIGQDNVSEDVIKKLADEVWSSYSSGLTDLIEMDVADFLADLDALNKPPQ